MASRLIPDAAFSRIADIRPDWLESRHIKGLILDLDNTLAGYADEHPPQSAVDWVAGLASHGIEIIVLSNNNSARVEAFCAPLGVRFVGGARKPMKRGYLKAASMLGLPADRVAVVGDQIFTDIWGAKRCGMTAIIVDPFDLKGHTFYRLRRALELPLIKRAKQIFKGENSR